VRLTSSSDFGRVLKSPDFRKRLGPLRIICRKNNMHFPRLGLIVGKRAVPNAVERNRIKRVIRDYFRRDQHGLDGYDVVVQIMGDMSNPKLRGLLAEAFGAVSARPLAEH
jgi:ribonuclease P protein component